MTFFNIDLHIAVIRDVITILEQLGHQVESWSISSHCCFAEVAYRPSPVIGAHNWQDLNNNMIDAFWKQHREEFSNFDGFIVTHTPSFALLFERWEKPIIAIISTRYEAPFAGLDKSHLLARLNELLRSPQVILVANNRYDQKYTFELVGRRPEHIESLCSYITSRWRGGRGFVSDGRGSNWSDMPRLPSPWTWDELVQYDAVFQSPYNFSVMSWFERAWAGIPIAFPSLNRLHGGNFFNERSWFPNFPMPTLSDIALADFCYFDGVELLEEGEQIDRNRCRQLSEAQLEQNNVRENRVLQQWGRLLKEMVD